ncbi:MULTISPECIES: hypothetical protein [Enterobacteriaceae]|uniref:DUF1161 domain-containing protein n=1 Tax=Lelliottia wanjuensis TaxID=3050585 RepID=A0AAP4FXM6_9ENTR|nr:MULTISPECIES: hypothetical protein [unclassified Lelliottia]MDK9365467.1 hypothetical protein [Lelliottia sp. V106_12]MDK9587278.1 hypothetical protein [Lelliottia sp. V86_10]MDK9615373.1 hypothetical protein [Lelliottia sp. V106_9]
MKKIVTGAVLTALVMVSFSTMAQADRAQMRQNFETKMVQPCQGKKAGDEVTITTRRGDKVQAVCTLTAVPKPQS